MRVESSLVALLVLAGCGGASPAGGTTAAPSAPASASQFLAAIDIARQGHPEAQIFEVEIDDHAHPGFLEVEYWENQAAREVFIDPGTMEVVAEAPDVAEPAEEHDRMTVRSHLRDGRGDLRAALAAGLLDSHDVATVQEVELTILDGHYVIGIEVLRDGARSMRYHAIDGTHLGTAEEALAHYASRPGEGHD